eukprot:scaffold194551_cov24-Tisochrysis_lutea.AAC.2
MPSARPAARGREGGEAKSGEESAAVMGREQGRARDEGKEGREGRKGRGLFRLSPRLPPAPRAHFFSLRAKK